MPPRKRASSKPDTVAEASDSPKESPKRAAEPEVVVLGFLQLGATASIGRRQVEQVQKALESSDLPPSENVILDVWLESPGGDAHAAYKIGLVLRSFAKKIRFVIPDYAKSAATLLTLVADEIYMAPAAELGPLDAQIGYEQEGMTVSALDRARSLDELTTTAMDIVISGGAMVMDYTRLSRAETVTSMLGFAAQLLNPVVSKLDPTVIHWSSTLLKVAVEYGQRLLDTREETKASDSSIPRRLLEEYPTHGFVVSFDEAKNLGLNVLPLRDYEYAQEVVALREHARETSQNVIGVIPIPVPEPHTGSDKESEEVPDDQAHSDGVDPSPAESAPSTVK